MVVLGLIIEELLNINVKCVKYRSRSPGQGTCQASTIKVKHYARFSGCRSYI